MPCESSLGSVHNIFEPTVKSEIDTPEEGNPDSVTSAMVEGGGQGSAPMVDDTSLTISVEALGKFFRVR